LLLYLFVETGHPQGSVSTGQNQPFHLNPLTSPQSNLNFSCTSWELLTLQLRSTSLTEILYFSLLTSTLIYPKP